MMDSCFNQFRKTTFWLLLHLFPLIAIPQSTFEKKLRGHSCANGLKLVATCKANDAGDIGHCRI